MTRKHFEDMASALNAMVPWHPDGTHTLDGLQFSDMRERRMAINLVLSLMASLAFHNQAFNPTHFLHALGINFIPTREALTQLYYKLNTRREMAGLEEIPDIPKLVKKFTGKAPKK